MAIAPGPDPVPCPCDACDEYAGMPDSYCITCLHFECSARECKCPPAQESAHFCDACHQETETVKAHPNWDENRICGDCHPAGVLPDEEEWWLEDDIDDTRYYPDRCTKCDDSHGFEHTAACRSCGYIPPENRW